MCGEKPDSRNTLQLSPGSPPHVRGKAQDAKTDGKASRITPAYAGKSASLNALIPAFRDHPRVCGEKANASMVQENCQGSPPRMRGKALGPCAGRVAVGITPAYAGKRKIWNEWFRDEKDHPRMCGEKTINLTILKID